MFSIIWQRKRDMFPEYMEAVMKDTKVLNKTRSDGIRKTVMTGKLSCQRGYIAESFYYWRTERSAITVYPRLKKIEHSRLQTHDLQQLFHLYVFPHFAKQQTSPVTTDLRGTPYIRRFIVGRMISTSNFLIFICFAVGNFTSDVRFVFSSNSYRV